MSAKVCSVVIVVHLIAVVLGFPASAPAQDGNQHLQKFVGKWEAILRDSSTSPGNQRYITHILRLENGVLVGEANNWRPRDSATVKGKMQDIHVSGDNIRYGVAYDTRGTLPARGTTTVFTLTLSSPSTLTGEGKTAESRGGTVFAVELKKSR